MNNQSKAYAIILYLIWPISALFIGIKNFDTRFGRMLFISLYAFLGFTAISVGDLQGYEDQYYLYQSSTFTEIFAKLITLQDGKFYNSFFSLTCGLVFKSHQYYFLILFVIYGYFYISTIHLLKEISLNKLNLFKLIFFTGVLLFLLIRPIHSLAFYSGGVFILFNIVNYYRSGKKKYLFWVFIAPLFHIGLTIYVIVPVFLIVFKNRTWFYVLFVLITFVMSQSNFVGFLEGLSTTNTDTIIESKFNIYASDEGKARLDRGYAERKENINIKAKSLDFLQNATCYFFVPLGITLLFLKRKYLLVDESAIRLFHIVLLFWGISNLMLNISQGERFLILFSFVATALFFIIYIKTESFYGKTIFRSFLHIFAPFMFSYGLMAAYASNAMVSFEFLISNFFIEFFV